MRAERKIMIVLLGVTLGMNISEQKDDLRDCSTDTLATKPPMSQSALWEKVHLDVWNDEECYIEQNRIYQDRELRYATLSTEKPRYHLSAHCGTTRVDPHGIEEMLRRKKDFTLSKYSDSLNRSGNLTDSASEMSFEREEEMSKTHRESLRNPVHNTLKRTRVKKDSGVYMSGNSSDAELSFDENMMMSLYRKVQYSPSSTGNSIDSGSPETIEIRPSQHTHYFTNGRTPFINPIVSEK